MNKQEIAAVVALALLLLGWMVFQQKYLTPPRGADAPRVDVSTNAPAPGLPADTALQAPPAERAADVPATTTAADPVPVADAGVELESPAEHAVEEQHVVLSNGVCAVTVSSWGAAVSRVELKKYRSTVEADSGPVVLDFSGRPALGLSGIPGVSPRDDFEVRRAEARSVTLRSMRGPWVMERQLTLDDGYRILVEDRFTSSGGPSVSLPVHSMDLGPMLESASAPASGGVATMGVDTLADEGGEGVHHWGSKDLPGFFGHRAGFLSCSAPNVSGLPAEAAHSIDVPLSWMAVKNKYFVQILAPELSGAGGDIRALRLVSKPVFMVSEVSGSLRFGAVELKPGEGFVRRSSYYAGPKEYVSLKGLGAHQADVMEFGWWEWFRGLCKGLLWTLNAIYRVIPNYGVAIILLTLIVKVIFWPVTHKSTESMKKMQAIQPLVAELRAKYKDKPQKLNQETMELYRKHKVNPMAGCLPMAVQIPVFIALFIVLRSAVELRFAPFLWIRDLSEPEGILAGVLPIPLNILPLLMTATTILQTRLTPSAGDPMQQRMMMFMPIVMLFLFYSMPSALVLYWTVSQALSIVQLMWQRRRPVPVPTPVAA